MNPCGPFLDIGFGQCHVPSNCRNTGPSDQLTHNDNLTVTIQMENGSVVIITHSASGASSMPKARVELLGANSLAVLEDFRSLYLFKTNKKKRIKHPKQEKGYKEEISSYIDVIRCGGKPLISFEDSTTASLTTFAAIDSLKMKEPVEIDILK